MGLKEKFLTKVFSAEGTEKSQKGGAEPMKPSEILPIRTLAITSLIAIICIAPFIINLINQAKF